MNFFTAGGKNGKNEKDGRTASGSGHGAGCSCGGSGPSGNAGDASASPEALQRAALDGEEESLPTEVRENLHETMDDAAEKLAEIESEVYGAAASPEDWDSLSLSAKIALVESRQTLLESVKGGDASVEASGGEVESAENAGGSPRYIHDGGSANAGGAPEWAKETVGSFNEGASGEGNAFVGGTIDELRERERAGEKVAWQSQGRPAAMALQDARQRDGKPTANASAEERKQRAHLCEQMGIPDDVAADVPTEALTSMAENAGVPLYPSDYSGQVGIAGGANAGGSGGGAPEWAKNTVDAFNGGE